MSLRERSSSKMVALLFLFIGSSVLALGIGVGITLIRRGEIAGWFVLPLLTCFGLLFLTIGVMMLKREKRYEFLHDKGLLMHRSFAETEEAWDFRCDVWSGSLWKSKSGGRCTLRGYTETAQAAKIVERPRRTRWVNCATKCHLDFERVPAHLVHSLE